MNLRPYQQKAIESINQLEQKTNKQALVLATGLGKTVVFSHLISQRKQRTGKRALILAHREELLDQAKDKLEQVDAGLSIAVEQANRRTDGEDVVIASVATIGRKNSPRLTQFDPDEFSTIVIDEAHHASADSYKSVLDHFGVLKEGNNSNRDILLLGVTATPNRNDNKGIDQIFDDTAYTYGLVEAIQDDWLCDIKARRVNTATDLTEVHNRGGDFVLGELASAINNPKRNALIVKNYVEQLSGKQALVFAADIAHATALTEVFQERGVKAELITGELDKKNRHAILEAFYTKQVQVVVNCMVLTEGYDNPSIDAILMARPTQSGILYSQMVGRGTRKAEGKTHLELLDFVDNTSRHTLKTAMSLAGIDANIDLKGQSLVKAKTEIENLQMVLPNVNLDRIDLDKIKYFMEEVDILGGLGRPDEVRQHTSYSWHRFGLGGYRLTLKDYKSVLIEPTVTGQYAVFRDEWSPFTKKNTRMLLGECQTLAEAIKRSDLWVAKKYPKELFIVATNARWRNDPPSDNQLNALRYKYRVSDQMIQQIDSKGMAADLMNKLNAIKARRVIL